MISRVCEEFDIDPVRALWVMDHAPAGMIADILELRAYAATWAWVRLTINKPGAIRHARDVGVVIERRR